MELWRARCKRILAPSPEAEGGDTRLHQRGEILCAVTVARDQERNRLADEANTIDGQELRHSVADAGMPIAGDPRLVVEWQIASQ